MRKLYGEFGYIDFVPEPNFDIVPNTRPDRSHPDRRRRQAVLHPPHRFLRQHHHARQGHPPRNPARRRRHVQHPASGTQHPAPEPARLFRNAEEGRSRRHQAQSAVQHRRHHAQGEGARQELDRPERRRLAASPAASSGSTTPPTTSSAWAKRSRSNRSSAPACAMSASGFTEPYFLDRPLQLGFVVYLRRFNFDQGREASILSGQNLIPLYNQLGTQNLLNYVAEQPRLLGLGQLSAASAASRAWASPTATTSPTSRRTTDAAQRTTSSTSISAASPDRTRSSGIRTSHIVAVVLPTTRSTTRSRPTGGRSLFISTDFAGSFLGGNVNTIRATDRRQVLQAGALAQEPHPGVPRHGLADHRLRRQVRPAVLPHLHRRRAGHPRIRDLGHHARSPSSRPRRPCNVLNDDGTPRTQKVDQRRRGRQRAGHHDGPDLSADHARRRHAGGGQFRIPHPDRRAGDAGAVRRRRREQDPARQPAHHGSEPRVNDLNTAVPAGGLRRAGARSRRARRRCALRPASNCR